jgi:hypothetical protein
MVRKYVGKAITYAVLYRNQVQILTARITQRGWRWQGVPEASDAVRFVL